MRPVYQKHGTDERSNIFGDCLRACVASLTELPLDETPHFRWGIYEDEGQSGSMWFHLRLWLRARNIGLIVTKVSCKAVDEALQWCMTHNPESYLMLGGKGVGGQDHVCIVHKGKIVHEPGRPNSGKGKPSLVGPLSDGAFIVMALEYRPTAHRDNVGLLGVGSLEGVEIPAAPDCSILDRHERIGLAFSGGKDSLTVLKLLEAHWSRLHIFHVDAQSLLPETKEVVAHAQVMTKGKVAGWTTILTNAAGWQEKFGLASDLVSHDCTDTSANFTRPSLPTIPSDCRA